MSVFKRRRFPAEIVLLCVRWYCRYGISYRDLEEIMDDRGAAVAHVTLYRCPALCAGDRKAGPLVPGLPLVVLARGRDLRQGGWQVEIPVPCRRQARTSDRFHAVRPPEHQGGPPLSGQSTEGHAQLAAGVGHHRQAWFLSEGPAPAETEGRAERHGPAPDVEVPQQPDRGRSWCAQAADPSHQGLPVDEDRLRHDQGLRDHAHPTPPLHPDRTRGHRRSAIRQQTLRSRRLIRAAERGRFSPTAVNATEPPIP